MSVTELTTIQTEMLQLRMVADFLERHERTLTDLGYEAMMEKFQTYNGLPYVSYWIDAEGINFTCHGENQRDTMTALRRAFGGKWDKSGYGDTFKISRSFAHDRHPDVTIDISISGNRPQICQRVVVGVKEIVRPAVEAQPERIEYQDEVEWVCGNLLDD